MSKKKKEPTVIMVDCFNTIILRNKSNKQIFQNWAREVATVFGVDEVKFLKTYNHINWALCTKKLFSRFVLQAKFEDVLDPVPVLNRVSVGKARGSCIRHAQETHTAFVFCSTDHAECRII